MGVCAKVSQEAAHQVSLAPVQLDALVDERLHVALEAGDVAVQRLVGMEQQILQSQRAGHAGQARVVDRARA